jgi:hypothetical protein
MPVKLNIGLSRKVGEPNYGSRGASIHLEVEMENGVLNDPALMRDRVQDLYALARQSVDNELQRPADEALVELAPAEQQVERPANIHLNNGHTTNGRHANVGSVNGSRSQPHQGRPANGRLNEAGNSSAGRLVESATNGDTNHRNGSANGHTNRIEVARATQSQIRAIFAITKRQGLDPHTVISERFRVHRMEDLTIREASAIIDELKSGAGVRS